MEAARSSETLVNLYQTTQRYNPEDSHLPSSYCHILFIQDPLYYDRPKWSLPFRNSIVTVSTELE
jgi:hypothetical protein